MNNNLGLGPSWIPKLGGIIAAIGAALAIAPEPSVAKWSAFFVALGAGLIGFTSRQNNVSSEKAGADVTPTGIPPTPPPPKIGLILIPFLALWMIGCGTTGPINTKTIATLAGEAADIGGRYEIQRDPGSRPAFVAVRDGLRGMLHDKNYDPATFAAALQQLHIRELKSENARLVISAVVILWEPYASKLTDLDEEEKVLPVIIAVEEGLSRAIEATSPPPPPTDKKPSK